MLSRLLQIGISALVLQCAGAVTTAAAAADPFADVTPMASDTLADERAGFITAAGVTLDIGATVQTTVNGQLALLSTLTLNPQGGVTQTTWINPNLPNATKIDASDASALSAITGLDLKGIANPNGVVIKDNGGVTALLTNVSPAMIQNLVINTANGQTINQTIELNVTLPGFAQTQANFSHAVAAMQMTDLLNFGQLFSARH